MENIKLTPHQEDILIQSLGILETGNRLVITGKAGTGKTTLVKFLLKELKRREIDNVRKYNKSICSAPTNKAVKVLKSKMTEGVDENYFQTTHSALKLKRNINFKTGAVTFKPEKIYKGNYPLKNVSILIIDEASMLNSKLLQYIEESALSIKVIFIGDEAQIPPVGEPHSPVFYSDYPIVELTEIIRQSEGNPIIELSRNLDLMKSKVENRTSIGGYIFTENLFRVIRTLANVNGTDELKYLAWTNREVDFINFKVRELIYGNPNKVELGESLIFNSPYGEYFTNEEIKVKKIVVSEKKYLVYRALNPEYNTSNLEAPKELVKYVLLKTYEINDAIYVLHEDSEITYKQTVKHIKEMISKNLLYWNSYYNFIESFADIKYNHAITVHKSQGSTYNQVIINVSDINYNKDINEREKLFYTAITRAENLVVLYK